MTATHPTDAKTVDAELTADLVAAWNTWETHPGKATALFGRDDAIRATGRPVTPVVDRIRRLRSNCVPTADAVPRVLLALGGEDRDPH